MEIEKLATLPERELAAEIAEYLAEKLWNDLGPVNAKGELWNIGQSNYEEACRALNLVDVYQQADHYTLHRVLVSWEQVRAHVAALDKITSKAFELLLSAFVENSINYDGFLSGTKRAFNGSAGLRKLMGLLVRCGYATTAGDNYQWTDKIRPFMQHWHIWTETGDSRSDLARSSSEEKSADMAATIPEAIKRKIREELASGSPLRAISVVKKHWVDEQWHLFPARTDRSEGSSTLDMGTARALLQKITNSS